MTVAHSSSRTRTSSRGAHSARPAAARHRRLRRRRQVHPGGRLLHDSKSVLADQLEAVERGQPRPGPGQRPTWRCSPTACAPSASRASPSTWPTATSRPPRAVLRPRRHPGARAVHPQHGHRRLDRRARPDPRRRPPRRVEQTRRHLAVTGAARRPARGARGQQDGPGRLGPGGRSTGIVAEFVGYWHAASAIVDVPRSRSRRCSATTSSTAPTRALLVRRADPPRAPRVRPGRHRPRRAAAADPGAVRHPPAERRAPRLPRVCRSAGLGSRARGRRGRRPARRLHARRWSASTARRRPASRVAPTSTTSPSRPSRWCCAWPTSSTSPAATSSRRPSTSRRLADPEIVGTLAVLSDRPLRARDRAPRPRRHPQRPGPRGRPGRRARHHDLQRGPAPGPLPLNAIGRVRVRLAEPVPLDDYADLRRTGAFLLVDEADGTTLAAGMAERPPTERDGGRAGVLTVGVPIGRHASTSPTLKEAPVADTPGYPATLRLAGRRVLVVGGGTVATRRIPALLDAGAEVDVIAPDAAPRSARQPAPDGSGGGSGGSSRATSSSRSRPGWRTPRPTRRPSTRRSRPPATSTASGASGPTTPTPRACGRPPWPTAPSGPAEGVTVAVTGGGDPRRAAAVRDAVLAGLDSGLLPVRRQRPPSGPDGQPPGGTGCPRRRRPRRPGTSSPSAGDGCSPRRTSSSPTGSARATCSTC